MKVEVTSAPKKFEPITLTITFETREELLDMWVRHTITNDEIVKLVRGKGYGEMSEVVLRVGKPTLVAAVNSTGDTEKDVPLLVVLKKEILK